jgi:hypothetical protein
MQLKGEELEFAINKKNMMCQMTAQKYSLSLAAFLVEGMT